MKGLQYLQFDREINERMIGHIRQATGNPNWPEPRTGPMHPTAEELWEQLCSDSLARQRKMSESDT